MRNSSACWFPVDKSARLRRGREKSTEIHLPKQKHVVNGKSGESEMESYLLYHSCLYLCALYSPHF